MARERVAAVAVFATNGALWGSFAPRLPDLAARLDVSAGVLGLLVFAFACGGLAGSLAAGRLVRDLPPRTVVRVGVALAAAGLLGAAAIPAVWVAGVAMLAGGVGDGLQDVGMNAAAVDLERRRRRATMPGIHAAWSVGFLGGALIGSLAAGAGVAVATQMVAIGGLAVVVAVLAAGGLRAGPDPASAEPLPFADRAVLLLGVTVAVGSVMEAVPFDWSALYLREVRSLDPGVAGLGVAGATAAALAVRLVGDRLVDRYGAARALAVAATASAVAFVAALTTRSALGGLVAFAAMGAGAALVYPVGFSLAGTRTPAGGALAAVATAGRLGFLVAPLAVGAVADAVGIGVAVLLAPAAALTVAALTRRLPAPVR